MNYKTVLYKSQMLKTGVYLNDNTAWKIMRRAVKKGKH